MKKLKTAIKWSGSKNSLSTEIVSHFPNNITGNYIEPFLGGGSVLIELLSNPKWGDKRKNIKKYICNDLNTELIEVWGLIKKFPALLSNSYQEMWEVFNSPSEDMTIEQHRKNYFNVVRDIFNDVKYVLPEENAEVGEVILNTQKTTAFYFLLRTCVNGLVRYNSSGRFNSSCHFTRPGMHPDKVRESINDISALLNNFDVEFESTSYLTYNRSIESDGDSFIFMDPPYSSVDKNPMYFGKIDEGVLVDFCNRIQCGYAITYDGDRGENKAKRLNLNNTELILLEGKNSSYSRLNGKNVIVNELMYVKKNK